MPASADLEKSCDIQVAALSSGSLRLPDPEVSERTARQFAGDTADDYTDEGSYDLAWAALIRLLDRIAPEYAN
ncbi:hypothetical protein J2T10_002753 [Paenarthrobacter nicotinovorans]|uniref:Uncharacterized protein n=1 Tax=Paenarthrobacter nicotinovorans TaxID=29320 RepID=A0ABT9TN42_PAENI|nr:hypothetical protein [Paenarthrobacter nicotinovorans]MDQ0103096.1 hypothetical protein [Paenarthrobacter nicotinovorans]GAT88423.1 aldolase [Paenarthrobacter nicotinovorans]